MHGEAGDPVHHRLACREYRHVGGQAGRQSGNRRDPFLGDEQRYRGVDRTLDEHPHHDLALGDEQPLAPDQVPLADVTVGGDARSRTGRR